MLTNDMIKGLDKLSAKLNADYCKFVANTTVGQILTMNSENDADYFSQKSRIRKFNSELQYTVGKKYIKFMSGNSCWGFIVIKDDDKFKRGDILKAATYRAPARNFARGNILKDDLENIRWEGVY